MKPCRLLKDGLIILSVLFTLLSAAPVLASEATGDAEAEPLAAVHNNALVIIDGNELFSIKTRIGSFYQEDRARLITERIIAIARDNNNSVDQIVIRPNLNPNIIEITAPNQSIATVTLSDAEAEGVPIIQLAEERKEIIQRSIRDYRDSRQAQRLIMQSAKALFLTVLLMGFFYLARRGVAYYKNQEEKIPYESMIVPFLKIPAHKLFPVKSLRKTIDIFGFSVILLFSLLLIYIYLVLVLRLFPWTITYSNQLGKYVGVVFSTIGQVFLEILPNLLIILAILFVSGMLRKLCRLFFDQIKFERIKFTGFYPDWADTTHRIVTFIIIAITIICIFPYIPGTQSLAFQGVSVLLGVLISIGSTAVVANVVAGIALTYTRSFVIGDRVKIGDHMGDIVEKSLLSIRMRTMKNEDITIPNSAIINNSVVNYSSSSRDAALILHITVTLGYNEPWQSVHDLLIAAASKTPDILADPKPFVLQTQLNDFTVSYEINAFTNRPNRMAAIYSEMYKNIIETLKSAGIDLNTPQQITLLEHDDKA